MSSENKIYTSRGYYAAMIILFQIESIECCLSRMLVCEISTILRAKKEISV